jgi:putative SOS response-associated peptidase YedK
MEKLTNDPCGPKQPYAIGMANDEPFAIAGIWDWKKEARNSSRSR